MCRFHLGLLVVGLCTALLAAAEAEYRTVETAIKATARPTAAPSVVAPAYIGVQFQATARPVIELVAPGSPADQAGLKPGDRVEKIDGLVITSPEEFRAKLRTRPAGERVRLAITREGKLVELPVVLAPASRPMKAVPAQPSLLGIEVSAVREGEGVLIDQVLPGSVAERLKLKVGETLLKLDDTLLTGPDKFREVLAEKKPEDMVTLTLLLAEKQVEMKVKLEAERRPTGGRGGPQGQAGPGGGWNRSRYWTRPVYKIAIILVEYPDTKHNPKIPAKEWADAMFSRGGKYTRTATGQTAHGSMADYYWEQSHGQLEIKGTAFDYVEVSKKRAEYGSGGQRTALLTEAMDKLLAREGKDALKEFDGVFFIYAGGRMSVPRGSLYWPHKSNVTHNGKSWPYFICPEGGDRMANISVFCHEFGHMLGLPDLYARPENPGMEGVGIWCAMANQAGNGRPQHFSAWCKEKLGWVKPTVIDPTVKQKLILAPIGDSPKECFKVLLQPDGSEYLLLENRRQKGFDQSLPAEGLLIWRVVGNRPILEESHGVAGPSGPRQFLTAVPFPSTANDAFTPYTTPSSRSQLGGGLPVHITNIKKHPDGKVSFHIGYEYQ